MLAYADDIGVICSDRNELLNVMNLADQRATETFIINK